ncbi:ATP-binding protein [Sandaracinus amylolyticus]|uniref:ATP-binding response regulator n=1 Tax=Sandaracinus amylolyticus TaxID=927083 RepID=UPI00069E41C3|nr:ATP-binding protein [Sandaracinus amylolyticus]
MSSSLVSRLIERHSRELALACDASSAITWRDERAVRVLGVRAGQRLTELACPGAEEKLGIFCDRAKREPLEGWELCMLAGDRPVTLVCASVPEPDGSGFAIFASVLPEEIVAVSASTSDALREVDSLNRELARQGRELLRVNHELSESNRGIVQLHDELAQRAEEAATSAEVKSRLVANVSHEFRTPIHSILGLSQLLLDETDGPLTEEQRTQVRFVRSAAEELALLVNDMLDLARLESGIASVRASKFSIGELFETLRGMLRPLLPADSRVQLSIDAPAEDVVLETDRGKIAQVLRNLVTNGIKYTEQGEVRVDVTASATDVRIAVVDTGMGISPNDLPRVFEEFYRAPAAAHLRGTGLGLPLSRKLAELLGGAIEVESELGKGSSFTLVLPRVHPEVRTVEEIRARGSVRDPSRQAVLVVEDDRKTIFVYERYLSLAGYQVIPARSIADARALLNEVNPAAIVLDIMLEGETSWEFLSEVKSSPATRDIPVLVVTVMNREQKARALGADEFWLKPLDQDRLLRRLQQIPRRSSPTKVLVIDDDPRARYLVRRLLDGTAFGLIEAETGHEGVRLAHDQQPQVIILDFLLEETPTTASGRMTAFDVIDALKSDPRTRPIPVIILSSHALGDAERQRLAQTTESILSKENLSRELAMQRIRDALHKAGIHPVSSPGNGG